MELTTSNQYGNGIEDGGFIGYTIEQRSDKKKNQYWAESFSEARFGKLKREDIFAPGDEKTDRGVNTHSNSIIGFSTMYDLEEANALVERLEKKKPADQKATNKAKKDRDELKAAIEKAKADGSYRGSLSPWFVVDHMFTDGEYDGTISSTVCRKMKVHELWNLDDMTVTDEDWSNTHNLRYWYSKSEVGDDKLQDDPYLWEAEIQKQHD